MVLLSYTFTHGIYIQTSIYMSNKTYMLIYVHIYCNNVKWYIESYILFIYNPHNTNYNYQIEIYSNHRHYQLIILYNV
jgi:hypothetical protein